MSTTWDEAAHRRAMDLAGEAEVAALRGAADEARALYATAAPIEQQCADAIGTDIPRTRGIIRVSAASLWLSAGDYLRAGTLADRYLAEGVIEPFAEYLREIAASAQRTFKGGESSP